MEALSLGRIDLYGDSYGSYFAQVFALRHGEQLRECDLTVQRPGTGIPAAQIDEVVRHRVRLAVPAGTMLQWSMMTEATTDAA